MAAVRRWSAWGSRQAKVTPLLLEGRPEWSCGWIHLPKHTEFGGTPLFLPQSAVQCRCRAMAAARQRAVGLGHRLQSAALHLARALETNGLCCRGGRRPCPDPGEQLQRVISRLSPSPLFPPVPTWGSMSTGGGTCSPSLRPRARGPQPRAAVLCRGERGGTNVQLCCCLLCLLLVPKE